MIAYRSFLRHLRLRLCGCHLADRPSSASLTLPCFSRFAAVALHNRIAKGIHGTALAFTCVNTPSINVRQVVNLTAFDVFCGCGGLSTGLRNAGISVRWAAEMDEKACGSYQAAHPTTSVFQKDATVILEALESKDHSLPRRGDVDILAGGPPCQGFSGYNRYRCATDPRNSLINTFLRYVQVLQPRYVLIENVPGMLSMAQGKVVPAIRDSLRTFGYSSQLGILQAGNFGIPQNRWRVFIWAAYKNLPLPPFPNPTHSFPRKTLFGATQFRGHIVTPGTAAGQPTKLRSMITVGDAIRDLPRILNGGGDDVSEYESKAITAYQRSLRRGSVALCDHRTIRLSGVQYERCCAVPRRKGAGWLDLPQRLKPANLLRHGDDRYPNRFGRLHWTGTFNTILHRAEPYWSCVFHPSQNRVLSVRECARAQSFPDLFRFNGTLRQRYAQIGNAVPPLLAEAIANAFMDSLS